MGISFWREDLRLEAELQITSDTSETVGFGVYFRNHWCAEVWPQDWRECELARDLTFREFFPLLVAVQIWGRVLENQTVHFWTDNLVVVQVVNLLTTRSPRVMLLVRMFTLLCLCLNVLFLAHHVPGINNGVADALSRQQMAKFRMLAPEADPLLARMPEDLWHLGGLRQVGR